MSAETGSTDTLSKGNESLETKAIDTSLSQMDWGKAFEDSQTHRELNGIGSS